MTKLKTILKTKEKLEFLLPYSNKFCEKLRDLHIYPQDNQLLEIEPELNNLVEGEVSPDHWPDFIIKDRNFITMVESFEELKRIRNSIIHDFKTLSYDEKMILIKELYENGSEINFLIKKNIDYIENKYLN